MIKVNLDSRYRDAMNYAFRKYVYLKREVSFLPYAIHPIRILSILREFGYNEFEHEDLMISVLLHDVIEDTPTKLPEIEGLFGKRVAEIVSELSHPEGLSKEEWLECFKFYSKEAKIVKIADRIDNLLDMEECSFPEPRKSRYYEQSKIILRTCGDANRDLAMKLYDMVKYRGGE